jgi:2-octaprenyl-6-methoxyphenol hydroxylase
VEERDYGQTAIVANVTPAQPHQHVAYERFTPQGPIALLPLGDQNGEARCALVWTHPPTEAERLLALDEASFLAELQAGFGQRLGRFRKVGRRHSYALQLIRAEEQIRPRLVLIGNAAHTLHPIAGQGLNLSLRDVATLAQCLTDAHRDGRDIGSQAVLEGYRQWRRRDHQQVIGFTNFLVQGFSNAFGPLAVARNLGLLATDLLPPVKHGLARAAMGLAGKLPRLARGLPL